MEDSFIPHLDLAPADECEAVIDLQGWPDCRSYNKAEVMR